MNEIVKLVDKVLPLDASKVGITYNESQNMLVTTGYTSYAGNTYFKGIRLSERIFIVFDIGIGYYHTFLNAVTVLTNPMVRKRLSAQKDIIITNSTRKQLRKTQLQLLKTSY